MNPRIHVQSQPFLLSILILLLLPAAAGGGIPRGLLMDDEFRVAVLFVPFEAGEVGVVEFVVGLFTKLLVNRIANILDGHAVAVAGGDFQPEGPFEVDAADGRVADEFLEIVLVFDGRGGGVDFPVEFLGLDGEFEVDAFFLEIINAKDAFDDTAASTVLRLHIGGRGRSGVVDGRIDLGQFVEIAGFLDFGGHGC